MENISSIEDLKSKLGIEENDIGNNLEIKIPFCLTDEELNKYKVELAQMGKTAKAERLGQIISEKSGITKATKEAKGDLKETLKTGDIEKLKNFLSTGKLNSETLKAFIENIKEVQGENKIIFLGLIFALLNQQGVSISKLTDKIELKAGKQTIGIKVTTSDEVVSYQNILNNFGITQGNISVGEIQKALLYKTSGIDIYMMENQSYSTNEYANRLITKYKDVLAKRGFVFTELGDKIDEENYLKAKKAIRKGITDNQADREFLSVYFDDLFYSKTKMSNDMVQDYAKNKDSNKTALEALNTLGKLDHKTKYALGIGNSDIVAEKKEKFMNDPTGSLKESLSNGGAHLGIILGLLWGIFGGKKGEGFSFSRLIAGFLGGIGVNAVGIDGISGLVKKGSKIGGEGGNTSYNWIKDNWIKEKLSGIGNFSQELYERVEFWYDFNGVKVNDGTGMKDLIDAKFIFLHNKANTEIGIFQKDGIKLSTEDGKNIKDKLNEYMDLLKNKYSDKTPNEIINMVKDKSLKEIIAEIYQEKEKQEQQSTEEKGSEKNTPLYDNTFTYKIKDGKTYLIGENSEYLIQNNTINEAGKEVLKKYEKLGILNEILQIWLPYAEETASSLLFKGMRTGTSVIPESIKNINTIFEKLFIKIQKGENIDADINTIWQEIEKAENATSIIGSSDISKVKQFFYDTYDNKDQKLLKIYNTMRYSGWSGNSEGVKNQVAEHLLHQESFKNIDDILKNPQIFEYIKNHNTEELEKILGTDITKEALSAYSKIKIKQEKNRAEYAKVLTKINQERKEKNEPEIDLNNYIELNTEISIIELLKHSLIRKQIFEMTSRGDEKSSYTGLYANITGLAKNKGNDWVIISDENIHTAIDVSSTIAIAAVSMGVGAIAARGALATARWLASATRLSTLLDKGGKAGKVAGFAGSSTVEGIAFYQGYNTMNNIIYGNNIFENALNVKEIEKTVAFMGVLRGLGEVMSYANWAKGLHDGISKTDAAFKFIGKMSDKVPAGVLKNTGEILIKGGIVSGSSIGLDYIFEGEADWTWEEYMQAVMLVGVMKGVGKITFKKGANGEVIAKTNGFFQKIGEKVSNKLANAPEQIKQNLKKTIIEMLKAGSIGGATFAGVGGGINLLQGEDFTENIITNFLTGFTAGMNVKVVFIGLNGLKHVFSIGKDGLLKGSGATASKLPNDWKKIAIGSGLAYGGYEVYSFLSND